MCESHAQCVRVGMSESGASFRKSSKVKDLAGSGETCSKRFLLPLPLPRLIR